MRTEPRHIDVRPPLEQLKIATIVTATLGTASCSEVP